MGCRRYADTEDDLSARSGNVELTRIFLRTRSNDLTHHLTIGAGVFDHELEVIGRSCGEARKFTREELCSRIVFRHIASAGHREQTSSAYSFATYSKVTVDLCARSQVEHHLRGVERFTGRKSEPLVRIYHVEAREL